MSKDKSNAKTVQFLATLQDRVTATANAVRQMQGNITELRADHADTNEELEIVSKKTEEALAASATQDSLLRTNSTSTTLALNALRDSTARAFDGVKADMLKALDHAQKVNARVSELEGANHGIFGTLANFTVQLSNALSRLSKLENQGTEAPSPEVKTKAALTAELCEVFRKYDYAITGVGSQIQLVNTPTSDDKIESFKFQFVGQKVL